MSWRAVAGRLERASPLSYGRAKHSRFRLYVRPLGEVFQLKYQITAYAGVASVEFDLPHVCPAQCDIQVRAEALPAGDEVTANFHGWYE